MSRLSNAAKKMHTAKVEHHDERETNFMGGTSYKLNPLETLKMVACSSIFGEPKYYREGMRDGEYTTTDTHDDRKPYTVPGCIIGDHYNGKTTSQVFEEVIDKALDYDFRGTIKFAIDIRHDFFMRLNPQIIMVRAAIHPGRKEFTEKNPGMFNAAQQAVMKRADEPATQCAYYMFTNKGDKNKMPSILKRSIAFRLSKCTPYEINKYKNAEIGMINAVRITHASSEPLNELMKTGTIAIEDDSEMTWEQHRSAGKSWREIVEMDCMPHMAMLRNIRNVFTEIEDISVCKKYMEKLKNGVPKGKQFPFRYESAYKMIRQCDDIHHKGFIMDELEECIDIAIDNLPKLKGKTMCLSDNSGSAWGQFTSEFGTETVAEIDNLSSVIAGKCSEDEAIVGKFGDTLIEYPVSKRNGALSQAEKISDDRYGDVGGSTEGGIWKFFRDAINNKRWFDNIFIFSDQQAGTGGLYGTRRDMDEYLDKYGCRFSGWRNSEAYIDVFKLTLEYRKKVNPKVNIFSVQTGGYKNAVIPMMTYRCAILYGWTGKEVLFAKKYIDEWDAVENARDSKDSTPWFLNGQND